LIPWAHISPTVNKLHPNPPTKNSFSKCWQKVLELICIRPHGVVPYFARVQDSNPSTKKKIFEFDNQIS
jgi:hypothetical protein